MRDDRGACCARSLVSKARRWSGLMQANLGALANTRGDAALQPGQAAGSLRRARLRMASKPPQAAHW
ncbi:hypothetical protein ASE76_15110 [Xylophilus sp. Leaf220]|nr:hypothetical protein ASE76_15110 [Xylophilus sp. Leaf220]